jgi:hypothetical protein
MKKLKTIDIVAREWFDRVNGNSYFSAYVTVNFGMPSEANFYLPFQYGYGDHYNDMCFDVLKKHGYVSCDEYTRYWQYYRDNNIVLRSRKIENCKKSEL